MLRQGRGRVRLVAAPATSRNRTLSAERSGVGRRREGGRGAGPGGGSGLLVGCCVGECFGGYSGRETPGLIPNPEAKPASADGTALGRVWESRTPPDSHLGRGPVSRG